MSYGQDLELGMCFQNSFGTQLTNSLFFLPVLSENIELKKEQIVKSGLRNVYDDGDVREGNNMTGGDVELEAHPILIGQLLKAVLGSPSTSVVAGAVNHHLFTPSQSDFDQFASGRPFTITKNMGDTGSCQVFYNLVATNLELNIAGGELLKCKMSTIGGDWTQTAAPAATFLTDDDWTWDVTSVQISAASVVGIKDMSIKIEQPNETHHTLGQGDKYPSHIKRSGFRTVTIGGTVLFNDQAEFQKFISQSERELIFTLRGATAIQSGYFNTLEVKVPKFRYTEFPLSAGGPGQIEVGINAKGIYSTTSATAIRFSLVNTQTGY